MANTSRTFSVRCRFESRDLGLSDNIINRCFVITLNNDTRQSIDLNIYDSFVNGIPTDYGTFELGPRSELEIRSSDVGANLFFDRGWFGIADFKL